MKSKSTDSLFVEIKEAKNTGDLSEFLSKNKENMLGGSLKYYLSNLLAEKNKSRSDVRERGGLSGYVDQIFNGLRNPTRDKMIRIVIGLGLDIGEAQELLRVAGHKALDPRDRRDSVIVSCINNHLNGIDTDLRLDKLGFKPLE